MPNKINTVLGFDFGMRYIGVAVGQTISASASALHCLKAQDGIPNWEQIAKLLLEWQADALIVGIPYNMDGSEQTMTRLAEKFGRRLQHRFQLPVFFVDERLTTYEAKLSQDRKTRYDATAAKIIVESWLRQGNFS